MSFVSAIGRRLVLAALFVLALSPSVRSDELRTSMRRSKRPRPSIGPTRALQSIPV
jgi:hypothetical protein